MKTDERWLTRLRALLGSMALLWELIADHGHQWFVFVICLWLLGGPLEQLITFLTAGRLRIEIKRVEVRDEDKPTDPPDPGGEP